MRNKKRNDNYNGDFASIDGAVVVAVVIVMFALVGLVGLIFKSFTVLGGMFP
jgi:hypothetical protein